jgi:hypothetical protein
MIVNMEKEELEKIKKRAKDIMKNNNLKVLNGEKDLIEQLNKISDENNENIDYNLINKTLDYIDTYIKYKEKMLLSKEDYDYLSNLSKELKDQSIRRTDDVVYIPLFKIMSKDGNEKYFLTRDSAKAYIELHNDWYINKIIQIEESDNTNLSQVIDIIKRNF